MKLTDSLYYYPENGMLDCNTYLIRGQKTSILIDPGFNQFLAYRLEALGKDGIRPEDINIISNTHLHIDHCWGNDALKEASGAEILPHPMQKKFYGAAVLETARFFGLEPVEFKEDGFLDEAGLDLGGLRLEFIYSPGHSPDSIAFYCKEGRFLVCGDVIFAGNTGRVDLPGGSAPQLKESIERLSGLDIEYLLPGHMNIVSGADKVRNNFEYIRKNVFPWL